MSGVGFPDPARFLDVRVWPRLGEDAPRVQIFNGPGGADGMSAGLVTGPGPGSPSGRVWLSRTQCTTTNRRISLSSSGLKGGQSTLGTAYKCEVAARVLIRVHAVFKRPARLSRVRDQHVATGRIASGFFALARVSGRPIFSASVNDETGKALLFVARSSCVPNP